MTHTSSICSMHLIPALLAQEQITDSRCDESRPREPDTHTPPLLIMTEHCSHFLTPLFVLSYHLCSGYTLPLKIFLHLMINICDVNIMIFAHMSPQAHERVQQLEEELSRLKFQHSSVSQQVTFFFLFFLLSHVFNSYPAVRLTPSSQCHPDNKSAT